MEEREDPSLENLRSEAKGERSEERRHEIKREGETATSLGFWVWGLVRGRTSFLEHEIRREDETEERGSSRFLVSEANISIFL